MAQQLIQQNPSGSGSAPDRIDVAGSSNAQAVRYRSSSLLQGAYGSAVDLDEMSIPLNARTEFKNEQKELFLRIAARWADAAVGQRYKTPLILFSEAWVFANCEIAYCMMVRRRGYNPGGHSEQTIGDRFQEAKNWILSARDYEITPDQRLENTEPFQVATVISDPKRNW